MDKNQLLLHLDKLHTTELGAERIKKNLTLSTEDVVLWCKEKIQQADSDIRLSGKNWYIAVDGYIITINKYSHTIITAHKQKGNNSSTKPLKQAKKELVFRFTDAINKQDLPAIIEMMAEDFIFRDTYGNEDNKEQMKTGWQGYFDWFPDYKIVISEYLDNSECAVILGQASGSYLGNKEKYWSFPAAWKIVVKGEQIKLWQVFCDSKKQLDSMN